MLDKCCCVINGFGGFFYRRSQFKFPETEILNYISLCKRDPGENLIMTHMKLRDESPHLVL